MQAATLALDRTLGAALARPGGLPAETRARMDQVLMTASAP